MYEHPHEHLLAELRRLDLILLMHLAALQPTSDAAKAEHAEVVALLAPSAASGDTTAWGRLHDVESALRRHIEATRRHVQESVARGIRLPIVDLCRALGLDAPSLGVLVIACARHLDRKYEGVFAHLQGNPVMTTPRVFLALDLLGNDTTQRFELRRCFEPTSILLRSGHVTLGEPSESSNADVLLHQPLRPSPRVLRHLMGHARGDEIVEAMRLDSRVEATESQREALARFVRVWDPAARPGVVATVVDQDPEGLIAYAGELARARKIDFVAVDLSRPRAARWSLEQRVHEAFREAQLLDALLVIDGYHRLHESERELAAREIVGALEGFTGSCILVGDLSMRLRREIRRRDTIELTTTLPGTDERAAIWKRALAEVGSETHVALHDLAWRYRLGSSEIRDAARMATVDTRATGMSWAEQFPRSLERACRSRARRDLERLAQTVEPRGEWADLILPQASLEQLRELIRHLKHHELVFGSWNLRSKVLHGDGVASFFAGPPGTGKTMASALIARALGRELFRVDLSGLVSKYIGETEKNLDKVFNAAARSNSVLLFDEADALFGKRTEVKDAHDRHANVETSYLLQRMEQFDGVVILATNLKKNVDEAFMRRMTVVVDFPIPDIPLRRRLWATVMPQAMPRESDIDLDFLAQRFEISGGHIKNAIQTAAMLAAECRPQVVSFAHLLFGVRRELHKVGRVLDIADFGKYSDRLEALMQSQTEAPVSR